MSQSRAVQLREGFAGQDMFVIPRPILARAQRHPLVRSVYPTDIGFFPKAEHHYRDRPKGAAQDHLILCVDGHGYATVDGVESQLGAGELLIIPRNTPHTYWASDDSPWSIYWVHFLGDDSAFYLERMPHRCHPAPVAPSDLSEAVRLFRYCLDALYEGYGHQTLIYAAQSIQHILSLLLYRNHALPAERRRKDWRSNLESMVEFMHENLAEPLRLEDFAKHAGLSISHFSDMFRSQTGQSPMAYFIQLRMRHACRLLDLSDRPVKIVALETGYSDPYYFSRVFKKAMGLSPEKYRAIKKG